MLAVSSAEGAPGSTAGSTNTQKQREARRGQEGGGSDSSTNCPSLCCSPSPRTQLIPQPRQAKLPRPSPCCVCPEGPGRFQEPDAGKSCASRTWGAAVLTSGHRAVFRVLSSVLLDRPYGQVLQGLACHGACRWQSAGAAPTTTDLGLKPQVFISYGSGGWKSKTRC